MCSGEFDSRELDNGPKRQGFRAFRLLARQMHTLTLGPATWPRGRRQTHPPSKPPHPPKTAAADGSGGEAPAAFGNTGSLRSCLEILTARKLKASPQGWGSVAAKQQSRANGVGGLL